MTTPSMPALKRQRQDSEARRSRVAQQVVDGRGVLGWDISMGRGFRAECRLEPSASGAVGGSGVDGAASGWVGARHRAVTAIAAWICCSPSFLAWPQPGGGRPRADGSWGNPVPLVSAMYSVEITVEKDKVTGETRVLSSTTLLPRDPLPQGVKVYEDETKGMRSCASCRGTHQGPGCATQPFLLARSALQNLGCVLSTKVKSRGTFSHCKAFNLPLRKLG